MPTAPTVLRPERSAHASIRGYLYQACLGVERWLGLKENEALLCEGDEDLDVLVRGTETSTGSGTSEQVKNLTGDAPLRVVRDTLQSFLWAWVTLRQRGETRDFRFTTTANLKPPGGRPQELDILWKWEDDAHHDEVVTKVREWVLHSSTPEKERPLIEEAVEWLGEEDGRWADFLASVTWNFDASDLDAVRRRIADRLTDTGLPLPDLVDRLVWPVLKASIQENPKDRVLTSVDLDALIEDARTSLARWAAGPDGKHLRRAFTDAEALQGTLTSGELDLDALPEDKRTQPSRLLRAAYQVVPFEGREEELAEVLAWSNDDRPHSVQLWFGDGGTGKSRLWIEACRRLRHQGWLAGFLTGTGRGDAPEEIFSGVVPRLVVVDYAETRLPRVRPLLERLAHHEGVKVRVVLLARHGRGWWEELGRENSEVEHFIAVCPPPREVSALAPSEERQWAAFSAAAEAFAATLDREAPQDLQPPGLTEDLAARALYLHMAALLSVLGQAPESVPELLGEILEHERRFWRRELERKKLLDEVEIEEVDAVVGGLVLCNGARSREGSRQIVGRLLGLGAEESVVRKLVAALHRLYEGEDGAYLEPLQPDLLGEALVDVALEREPELLDRVLEDADEAIRERLLTVLTRLAQQGATASGKPGGRWLERALARHLESLAEPALQVVLETGEPAGALLAQAIRDLGTDDLVRRLLRPFEEAGEWIAVAHREVAVALTERALTLLPETERQGYERARLLTNLGIALFQLGRPDEALNATQEAVVIRRHLVQQQPDMHLPGLAGSLANMGEYHATLGSHKKALKATQEAARIYRGLARKRPDAFRPNLAVCLNNLGRDLFALGHREAALAATQEGLEIRKQLARQEPHIFLPDLARSFNNLGNHLSGLGSRKQAFEASQEAVKIYRELARHRPDVYSPDLARSLNNLGLRLSALGRRQQALEATEEAVRTLLPFFFRLPQAFSDWMSAFLTNYHKCAEEANKAPDAEVVREVEEVFETLAQVPEA